MVFLTLSLCCECIQFVISFFNICRFIAHKNLKHPDGNESQNSFMCISSSTNRCYRNNKKSVGKTRCVNASRRCCGSSFSRCQFDAKQVRPPFEPKVVTGQTSSSSWPHVRDLWCAFWSFGGWTGVAISTLTTWITFSMIVCRTHWCSHELVFGGRWNLRPFFKKVKYKIASLCMISFCSVLWWLHHFWPAAATSSVCSLLFGNAKTPNFVCGRWYYSLCISCQVESVTERTSQVGRKLACAHRPVSHRCKKQSKRKWRGGVCAGDIVHLCFLIGAHFKVGRALFNRLRYGVLCFYTGIAIENHKPLSCDIFRRCKLHHLCLWIFLIYTTLWSLGEALNPGPPNFHDDLIDDPGCTSDVLWVGNCNPTQLLGKEEVFGSWGRGIWTVSESSATLPAFASIRSRLKSHDLNVQFGEPVLPQQASTALRGRAGGVAVITNFPVRKYQYPSPDYLYKSTRFVDTIVQVQNNLAILICTVYGVAGISSSHSMSLTHDIFAQAVDRVSKFKGPSIICGDLNIDLETIHSWNTLHALGWKDLAVLDKETFGRDPKPTSKFGHRHSYIIASPELCKCFKTCQVVETYDFDSHPLLVAGFHIPTYFKPTIQWKLPKPFDSFMFDEGQLDENASWFCSQRSQTFEDSLLKGDMDQAAKQFTLAFEDTLRHSAVNPEGNFHKIPEGHFGRGRGNPFFLRKPNVVNVKPGRNGEFTPILSQSNCSLRAHTRQLRRIQALSQQLKSALQKCSDTGFRACQNLWTCILNGHGFHKGFASWIGVELNCTVPLNTPTLEFVESLYECFSAWHKKELNEFYLQKNVNRKFCIVEDIANGGRWCFNQVRDEASPPLSTISWQIECEVKRVPWKKQGLSVLHLRNRIDFDPNVPVTFQGQVRKIVCQQRGLLKLDEPVKLKADYPLIVCQTRTSADVKDMHEQLHKTWSDLWGRDADNQTDDRWNEACDLVTSLEDCPSRPFKPLSKELWATSLRGVKPKSARGADGFSTRDCKLIKGDLLAWLIRILQSIEAGQAWPSQWCIAKITVLSKGFEPRSPLDIRPISILAKIYRLWSRLRSLEVLQHIGSQLPPQVAATSGGISADILAAFTANEIECSVNQKKWICGLIVDLVKCYNLIPWVPCKKICMKLGIPRAYAEAMFSHLKQLRRSFEVKGACSNFVEAKNGIAEGCAMSVALMAALSWFAHKSIENFTSEAFAICYADNWGLIANTPEKLIPATQRLEKVVDALRMKISIGKSWTWTTNPSWKNRLKQVKIHDTQVETKSNVVDLGRDQNYSRKRTIPTQFKRLAKAKRVLKRIRKLKVPQKFRSTMVQACGFGAFAYGSEITGVSNWTWKSLRSSVVIGLGKGSACASAFLSCLFHGTPLDPQLRHVVRTALFWRRFFTLFPSKKVDFLFNMTGSGKAKGPAHFFQTALNKIGWTASSDGTLLHDTGFQFNWVNCSRSYLRKAFRTFWSFYAAQMSRHRKDFDLASFDESSVNHCLAKRPPKDRSYGRKSLHKLKLL